MSYTEYRKYFSVFQSEKYPPIKSEEKDGENAVLLTVIGD